MGKSRLVHTLKEYVLGAQVEGEANAPVIEWRCSPHYQHTGLRPAIDFYEALGGRMMKEWLTVRLMGKPLEHLASTDKPE